MTKQTLDNKTTARGLTGQACPETDPRLPPRATAQAGIRQLALENIFPEPRNLAYGLIDVPPYAFIPDHWTTALQSGLSQATLKGYGLEVGVGTGVNVIYLLSGKNDIAGISGTDKDQRLLGLSEINAQRALGDSRAERYTPYRTGFVLVDGVDGLKYDFVFACIPQVPVPSNVNINEGDATAHYYDERDITASIDPRVSAYGLALNFQLLKDALRILRRGGKIILNLSGRPGRDQLDGIFRSNGYETEELHVKIVPQHPGTSLTTLVEKERQGLGFEFFGDPNGKTIISVAEAERRRLANDPVFHRIYVIQGTKH